MRFYFDYKSGATINRDDTGVELASLDAAIHAARQALADATAEALRDGPQHALLIEIRSRPNGPVLRTLMAMASVVPSGEGSSDHP